MADFKRWKEQRLSRADGSRKGSVDEPIAGIVQLLNDHDHFCTTSSCSGRLVVLEQPPLPPPTEKKKKKKERNPKKQQSVSVDEACTKSCKETRTDKCFLKQSQALLGTHGIDECCGNLLSCLHRCYDVWARWIAASGFEIQKKNCTWLLVTHQVCTLEDVLSALQRATDDAIFKFEPFVLHVQCQELQDAQLLHTVAIEAGFRNSGITVSRKGKIMMAVRSTHCLEVPLSQKGKLMVSKEYVDFVVQVANQKMEENSRRIDRFYSSLQRALESKEDSNSLPSEEKEENNTEDLDKREGQPKATNNCTFQLKNRESESEDESK